MKKVVRPLLACLFALLLLGGCGDSQSFVFTNSNVNPQATKQITVNHTLAQARVVGPDIVDFVFTGLDSSGTLVYGPDQRAKAATIILTVPVNTAELRIAYLGANDQVLGVYQQDLPEGASDVVVNDPDYIDADDFVASIAINPAAVNIDVGQGQDLTVTALLDNGTSLDVTASSALVVGDPAVASLDGSLLNGEAVGATQVTATLFNRSDTSAVNVGQTDQPVLEIRSQSTTLVEGTTLQLSAFLVVGSEETEVTDDVTWDSADEALATVDEAGLVSGLDSGQVDISASHAPSGTTAEITLTVSEDALLLGLMSSTDGTATGNATSRRATISDDGRYVAFESEADNLVGGDSNGTIDIFVKDRDTGAIRLVSDRSDGQPSDEDNFAAQISGNGRYVAWIADDDLVPLDTNGVSDVYLFDLQEDELELVSVNSGGTAAGNLRSGVTAVTLSADGRFVVFDAFATDLVANDSTAEADIFLRDRQSGTTELISVSSAEVQANEDSLLNTDVGVSDNGRYVVFASRATNLTSETDVGTNDDAFLRDRVDGTTTLLSVNSVGTGVGNDTSFATWISGDGATVLFISYATDLVSPPITTAVGQIYRYTVSTGDIELLTTDGQGDPLATDCFAGTLDDAGDYLLYTTFDTSAQVVLRDLATGEDRIVSTSGNNQPSNGNGNTYGHSLTPDGGTIVFASMATDLEVQAVTTTISQVYATLNPFTE